MPANPNWARWIFASAAFYLKTIATENQLPCIVEGLDDRTKAFMDSTDRAEIRINGPYIQEISNGYFRVWVDINVLLSSRMDETKGGYALQRFAGIMQAAMSDQIAIWNYGDREGDFDDDDPETQIHLGCLSPRPGKADSVKVLHFGQVEKADRLKQAAVDAGYQMYLDAHPG